MIYSYTDEAEEVVVYSPPRRPCNMSVDEKLEILKTVCKKCELRLGNDKTGGFSVKYLALKNGNRLILGPVLPIRFYTKDGETDANIFEQHDATDIDYYNEAAVLDFVMGCTELSILHEVQEMFKYDGKRVYNPHKIVDHAAVVADLSRLTGYDFIAEAKLG